jgi:hypothetical protein
MKVKGELNFSFHISKKPLMVNAVKSRSYPRRYWGQIARKCEEFLRANTQITLEWVNRKCNRSAHNLARWARVEPNNTWTDNLPPNIVNSIFSV